MQVTATFNGFEEMKEFARMVLGDSAGETGVAVEPHVTVQPSVTAPVTPTASTQPPAVTPAAPTAQIQPVAPTVTPSPVAAPTAPVQTSTVTYTPDDLARAAMALMDSGKQQELIRLLGQFGVVAIPELRPEQYGAFATALRGMGAQI